MIAKSGHSYLFFRELFRWLSCLIFKQTKGAGKMDKKDFAKKLGVVVGLGLVMVLQSSTAFARDDDRGQRGG